MNRIHTDSTEDLIMPVGKYAGRDIRTLPTDYLRWAVVNLAGADQETVAAMMKEFERRKGVYGFEDADGDRRADISAANLKRANLASLQKAWQQGRDAFRSALGKELPECTLGVRTSKTVLGTWYPAPRLLTISNYWIIPREVLQSVIIHEMCHQWITDMEIRDDSPHGRQWKKIAAVIGQHTGLHITRTTAPTGFKANPKRRSEPNIIYFY